MSIRPPLNLVQYFALTTVRIFRKFHMALLKTNVQLSRACRLLGIRWRIARRSSSGSEDGQETHTGVSDFTSRQIFQMMFNSLKGNFIAMNRDMNALKENATNRAASVDFDKLVHESVVV